MKVQRTDAYKMVERELEAHGKTITQVSSTGHTHWWLYWDGGRILVSASPSDKRGAWNTRADVRRQLRAQAP